MSDIKESFINKVEELREERIDEMSRAKARLYIDKATFDKKDRSKGISLARKKLMLGSKAKVPTKD